MSRLAGKQLQISISATDAVSGSIGEVRRYAEASLSHALKKDCPACVDCHNLQFKTQQREALGLHFNDRIFGRATLECAIVRSDIACICCPDGAIVDVRNDVVSEPDEACMPPFVGEFGMPGTTARRGVAKTSADVPTTICLEVW